MSETRTWRCLLSLRGWLLSGAFWLVVAVLEQSQTFRQGEDGQMRWVGLEWRLLLGHLVWYLPAVPLTMGLWWAAGRIVHARRFGLAFAGLVLGASLVSALWLELVQGVGWPWWGAGWILHYGPRFATVLGVLVAIVQLRAREQGRRELLAAQLRALRAQLQPHFLFNTLQVIGSLAPRDGAIAARMTALLGDLLRQTLRERGGELVSLAEECELLKPYLQLQQLRFADRLRIDLDLPTSVLAAKLPDLLLQPLVENALQHGIEQRPGSGSVRITARRDGGALVIDVHDDGVGLPSRTAEPMLGTGLGATKARLAALYGDAASLTLHANERGGTTASLRLPFCEVAHAA